jgi:carbon monoxide dehydrogenase subunit G
MRFTSREDIDLPADAVFAALSDFEGFERMALRRGADVRRTGDCAWTIRFRFRGRERVLHSEIAQSDPPALLRTTGRSGGIDGVLRFDLLPLSPRHTRLTVDLDLSPTTLPARLMLQSLRLAKGTLTQRFKLRVERFARDLEGRHGKPVPS